MWSLRNDWSLFSLKAAKYEIQKPSTLFRCKFSSMFPVFHLAWSTCRATKTFVEGWRKLLRKAERGSTLSNKLWLCYSFFIKLITCRAANLLVTWKINQSARRISSTRNNFFFRFGGSSWSRQVKNGKHWRKLATKQCCATSWGFLYLVFRRLYTFWFQYILLLSIPSLSEFLSASGVDKFKPGSDRNGSERTGSRTGSRIGPRIGSDHRSKRKKIKTELRFKAQNFAEQITIA